MDNIQQLILDTYEQKPKHFSQILKKNKDVSDYIKLNVPEDITNFLEQIYYILYKESNICAYNNKKQLKTFSGYSFCGRANVCKCAAESVGKNVSAAKQQYTTEKKQEINKKRQDTTMATYGVINNGQTSTAIQLHKTLYADKTKVAAIIEQIENTKLELYGNKSYNNRHKAENTCLEKYGVKNTWSLTDDKQNPSLDILRDKTKLESIFPKMSVQEIADTHKLHAQTVYYYLNKHNLREPYKSTFEKEIIYFLNELGITNIITNKRTIIGKELDIFLPDYNLAIEYNGVYWHHDKIPHITKTYHYDKFKLCEDKGIELFTIFSDSWENKKDTWKNKIKSKIGLLSTKVYARNTCIVELTSGQTRHILDNNHVQGYCPAQVCYGLEHNSELVAVMTFSKKRPGIGKDRGVDSYELVRYVTSKPCIGGASKLLKHFIKIHKPKFIFSYSDNQYSVGNLYKQLGFYLEKDNLPGYKYYNPYNKIMYHRFKFAKHNLIKEGFSSLKTEKEIMDERGFLRIWDCGTRTWVIDNI